MRNTQLETLHVGLTPVTRAGDYSDVFVEDADGRRIPWIEVSRIDENEMRELMQEIVNRLYTFHLEADDPKLQATIERWMGAARYCTVRSGNSILLGHSEPLPGHAPARAAHPGIPWSYHTPMGDRAWTSERVRRLRPSWNS